MVIAALVSNLSSARWLARGQPTTRWYASRHAMVIAALVSALVHSELCTLSSTCGYMWSFAVILIELLYDHGLVLRLAIATLE